MKTRTLSIITFCVLAFSCRKSGPDMIAETLLCDNTDKLIVKPTLEDALECLDISNHKWNTYRIRVQAISDIDYNRPIGISLESKKEIMSNPFARDIELMNFKKRITEAINLTNSDTIVKPRSSVYKSIIDEANRLSKLHAQKKVMLIYSDLGQNTEGFFSIYKKDDKVALKNNPDFIQKKFLDSQYIADLGGLTVFFIFRPKNQLDNQNFALMSSLFKSILEYQGAEVYVGASPFIN